MTKQITHLFAMDWRKPEEIIELTITRQTPKRIYFRLADGDGREHFVWREHLEAAGTQVHDALDIEVFCDIGETVLETDLAFRKIIRNEQW